MKTLSYFSQKPYAVQKSVRLLLAVCMVLFVSSNLYAGWVQVGTAGFSAGTASDPRLAFDSGVPFVGYQDGANSGRASVMKFNGTAWEQVGIAGFSADSAGSCRFAIDSGIPYVAYFDGANSLKASVMKFNGTAWEQVGIAGFSADRADYLSLAFDSGIPYLAYMDFANSNRASVMKFNGTLWEQVGIAGFSAGTVQFNSLAFDSGIPYVAYRDIANSNKASVMKFNGTAWEQVGIAGFSAGSAAFTSLAFDSGVPYVAYQDGANSGKASVMRFNGTTWELFASAGFSAGTAQWISFAFDSGIPYVAYQDGANSGRASVMKFNGSTWEQVGIAGFSADSAQHVNIAFDNGIPYAVYKDLANSDKASVMKYIADEPVNQANSLNFTSVTSTSISVNWIKGADAESSFVLIKEGSPVDADPADGAAYTADTVFGSGSQIGTGNFAVYSGTGNSVTVTGLTAGTSYYAAVYSFSGSGGAENYLISTPASGNIITAPGNALDFDGVDDYVDVPDGDYFSGDLTIEAWVYTHSNGIMSRVIDFGYGDFVILGLSENGDGKPYFVTYQSGPNTRLISPVSIPLNTWTHLAATLSGSTGTLYINGVPVISSPSMLIPASGIRESCFIGRSNWGGNDYADAKFDEIRIWDIARSQTDIQNNMNKTLVGNEPGLVVYYNFDQGTDCGDNTGITTLPDLTSGAHNGTLTNFALISGCTSNWGKADWNYGYPLVLTSSVSGITTNQAAAGGDVINEGFSSVTEKGVCWNTAGNPTINDGILSLGNGPGPFSGNITGLTPGTNYHVRAYAINTEGTSYGNAQIFTTLMEPPGNALDFTGSNNYVEMNDFQLGTSDFTIEFWMNGTAGGIDQYVLTNRTSEGDANGNWFVCNYLSASQSMGFGMAADGSGGGGGVNSLDGAIPAGVWHHVAITRDGTMITIFIDGVQNNQTTDSFVRNLTVTSNTARFGDWVGYNRPYQGKLDEVRIWNTARTQVQIQNSMNTTLTGNEAGLVAYYRFDRGTACGNNTGINTLPDLTSNGNDGTLYNFDLSTPDCSSNWTTADWNYGYPYVTTDNVANITGADAVVGGNVVNEGTSAVTARGICWNTTGNPTISDANISMGSGPGPFSGSMTGLTAGETYYVRAYAVNTGGTVYGEQDIFTPVMPPPGNALDFGGANNYVTVPDDASLNFGLSAYTLEAWIQTNDLSASQRILNKRSGADSVFDFALLGPNKILHLYSKIGAVGFDLYSDSNMITDNGWHHVAATVARDGVSLTVTFYVDGRPVWSYSGPDIGNLTVAAPVQIGCNDVFSNYFNGKMDEVRIWNVARTQAQIKNRMNNVIDPATPGLTAYYRFDNVSGTTLPDLTANANNGTLVNGPVWKDSEAFTVWTGAVSTDWNHAANWSDGVPTATDNVSIPAATPYSPEISISGQCGHLVIQSGAALNVPGTGILNVYGNWISLGTFNAGNSTVILSGQNQAVYGSNTFNILEKTGSGSETLTFAAGSTQTITNDLTLSNLFLQSTMPGTQWNMDAQGTVSASGLDVQNANAVTLIDVRGQGCTDSGNNINWLFANSAPEINLDPDNSLGGLNDGNNEVIFSEGGSAVSVADTDGAVTDAEDTVMQTLTLTATGLTDGIDEVFAVGGTDFPQDADKTADITAGSTTFTVTYTQSTGVFLISGMGGTDMPLTDMNSLLRSITYRNISETPTEGNRSLEFTVSDGFEDSLSVFSVISVTAENDIPTTTGMSDVTVDEDAPDTVTDLLTSFSDMEDGAAGLVYSVQNNTNPLLLTPLISGSSLTLTYTPDAEGTSDITIRGTDTGGLWVESTFTVTVNPVNDPPVTTGISDVTVDEDAPDTVTDLLTSFSDMEDGAAGLVYSVQNNTNPLLLTPLISGSSLTLDYTADAFGTSQISVRGTDSGGLWVETIFTVTVTAVNDAPEITGQNPLSVNEESPLIIQLDDLLVSDPDNTWPDDFSLTVQPGSNYTVSGTEITPAADFNGDLTVPVLVNDGTDNSDSFDLTVTVTAVNDIPVITENDPVSVIIDEDGSPVPFSLTLNAEDADGDTLNWTISAAAAYGTAAVSATGTSVSVTYSPEQDYNGTDSFTVQTDDGNGGTAIISVNVSITAINDAPVLDSSGDMVLTEIAEDAPDTANEGDMISDIFLTSGENPVSDADTDAVEGMAVTAADSSNGEWQYDSGNGFSSFPAVSETAALLLADTPLIRFVPDENFSGTASFTFRAWDRTSGSEGQTADTTVNGGTSPFSADTETVSVTVTAVNDAPVITGQNPLTIGEEMPLTISAGFITVSDPDNDWPADFSITVGEGDNYSLSGNTITPDTDFNGELTIPLTVNDGTAESGIFPLLVTVSSVNDIPFITGQTSLSTAEETPLTISPDNLTVTDSDSVYPDEFRLTVGTGNNYNVNGTEITPIADFNGVLRIPVQVNDGENDSNIFNLTVTVTAVNDAPVISGQAALSTMEDTPLILSLNDLTVSDPDSSYPSGFSLSIQAGTNYTVSGTTVTPVQDFNGSLSIPVTVNDGIADSEPFFLTVNVIPDSDSPVITGQKVLSMNEDTSLTIQLSDLTVLDPDSLYPEGYSLTVQSGTDYTVSGTTLTPAKDFNGFLTVPVQISKGDISSNIFNLLITVKPVNDIPLISGQYPASTDEDTPFTVQVNHLNVSDPDKDFHTLIIMPGQNYTVSGNTLTPDKDFSGILNIALYVNDGTDNSELFMFTLTVTAVNDPPVITAQISLSTLEEGELAVSLSDLTVTDPDNDYPADFSLRLQEGSGYSLSGNTVVPDKDFYGTLTIPVTVNDGKADSTVFSLTITVSNVNDTPEITSEPVTGATEDEPYSYEITVSDGDPEDSFTVSSDNLPPWLSLEGTVLSGTPGNDDTGEYSITLTVTDKEGGKIFQSFTLIVAGVNDAPVIIAQNTLSTPEMVALTVDPDDLIVEDPDNIYPEEFTLTLYPEDNYSLEGRTVTPLAGFIGTLIVPVSVNDGKAESPKYALKVEVTEKPEIRSISGTVTGLEKDREIYINAVSRDLDAFVYIRLRGTGEEVIPYIIENLKPSEDYRVEISSTDYAYQVWNGKETWETADELDMSERSAVGVDFTFTPPEAEISGRILFPESAQAGQSVLIRAYSPSTGSGGSTEIFLDENGAWDVAYTISRLLPADDYTVSLSSDSYLTRYFSGDGGSGVSGEGNAAAVSTRSGQSVDFIPDGGARISGTVTGDGNSGLRVEAWSDSLDTGSGALTSSDGSFAISGLEGAEDFRISVLRAEKSPIFYHPEGSVYDREKAGPVSTMSGSAENIRISLPEEKSIAGTVTDKETGNPLSGIWVDAQSVSQAAGGSAFSMEDGTYEISGLPPAADYLLTARTDRESPYRSAELSGIEAGERNADFLLASRPLLHIRGLILDSEGEPVPNVKVEISSDSLDIFVTSLDDLSGMQDLHIPNEYEIHGLPPADDYTVTARPPADSPFAVFIRTGVSVREDTDMNIIMTASFSLSGNISDAADASPLAGARVIAYSARKSFRSETVSGTDGSYRITNLPDTWDYRLTVTAEGYGSAEMINLSPSGDRDFLLHSVGEISGSVSDENGDPLTAVPVEILSPAADSATGFSGSVLTDKNGKFTVKGLHRYYDDGSPAEDYTLTAYPDDSPPLEAYGLKPDDRVELRITGENVTEFTGSVRNADGSLLPEGVDVFIDIFEDDGIFVMTADVSADGSFRNTSLHPERLYGLKFMAFAGDTLLAGEWAGQDGNGVESQNLAGVFDPAAPLNFRFAEMVRVPSSRRADYRAEISTSKENGVRNLRSLPFETVYKDGILTVLWDPSLLGEDPDTGEKYYYVFNQDSLFSVSKRTAPRRRPLTARTVTPESFRGDNSDFLCHVAPVDIRGQIGETRSLSFRVDTVPPLNPKISLPAKTTDRYVTLKLGAAGAAEMYLSNIAYGQGGIWEVRSQEKEWRLTEGDGLKKIYARFRDRAGNVVNAFATTEKVPDFDPDTQHKITVNAGQGGAVEPSGEVLVNSGDDLTLNVSPDTGYGTGTVTVDNIPVRLNNNSQFTLISIRADHTFAVTFAPLSEKTHVITATAGPYGSISPSGKITVPEGTDQVFSIVPVAGYEIAEVLADGQPVTPDADGGFVFRNVTGDHSISVTFR